MRVDRPEVELARQEDDHGACLGEVRTAARLPLGGLGEPVDRFREAVGLARPYPGDNAIDVAADMRATVFIASTFEPMTLVHHWPRIQCTTWTACAAGSGAVVRVIARRERCAGW